MEDFFHCVTKVLAHNIVVHIYSLPNFAIETFVYGLICIVHFLLILEVNDTVAEVVAKSSAKFQKHKVHKEEEKRSSIISLQTGSSKIQHHLRRYYENRPCFSMSYQKKMSTIESNGWVFPTTLDEKYDKIDQILSVTPSEFIRRDKEKKIHESELKSCLKSLSSILQTNMVSKFSNSDLQKKIQLLRTQLHASESANDLTELTKKTSENLYDLMEESLLQNITGSLNNEVTSHGDVFKVSGKKSPRNLTPPVLSNNESNTSFEIDSQCLNVDSTINLKH